MSSRALIFTATATFTGAAAALALAACGGGGGGAVMSPPAPSPSPTIAPQGCVQTALSQASLGPATVVNGFMMRPPGREPDARQAIVPGVVGVRFASRDPRQFASAASRVGGSIRESLDVNNAGTIYLPAGADPVGAARSLSSVPGVVASGPVVKRFALASQFIPNDADFGTLPYNVVNPAAGNPPIQWDMYVMNMPTAWALPTGLGSASVKIAIIDTGYDTTHPDLLPSSRVAQSIVFDNGNGLPHPGASVQDYDGHGTDVTGIAAADTNNAKIDAAGTAGGVTLLEARVFPTPSAGNPNPPASTNDVAAAIDWAVRNGAKVISMSLGSTIPDNMFEEPAVSRAIAKGVTVVAAAGNGNAQGIGQPTLDYPAADPGVIAVGASALCDGALPRNYGAAYEYVASYSNYLNSPPASEYFVVAPGGDPSALQVKCTTNACIDYLQWNLNLYSTTAFRGGAQNALFAGTSQATPHIAGLAALMLSKNASLTPAQIGSIISTNTVNINDSRQGHGRVDAAAALNAVP